MPRPAPVLGSGGQSASGTSRAGARSSGPWPIGKNAALFRDSYGNDLVAWAEHLGLAGAIAAGHSMVLRTDRCGGIKARRASRLLLVDRSSCRRRLRRRAPAWDLGHPRPSGVITGRTGSRRALPTAWPSNAGSRRCLRTTPLRRAPGSEGARAGLPPGGGSLHLPGERWAGYLRAYPRACPSPCFGAAAHGPRDVMDFSASPTWPELALNFPRPGRGASGTQSLHSHGSASPYRGVHPRRALGHGGVALLCQGPWVLCLRRAPGSACRCLGVSRRQGGARGNAGGSSGPGALGRA